MILGIFWSPRTSHGVKGVLARWLRSICYALNFYFLQISSKLKPQNIRDVFMQDISSWLLVLMFEFQLFPWYQKCCHAILIYRYGAFDEYIFLLSIKKCFSQVYGV